MHELVLFIIMAFSFHLSKSNKVGYFYASASGDKKANFVDKQLTADDVDNDEFSQICCLYRCEIINGFIKALVDNEKNEVIDMFLYF